MDQVDDTSDDDDDRDSLSAYNDDTSTLEQMMTVDFNDDSHVHTSHSLSLYTIDVKNVF